MEKTSQKYAYGNYILEVENDLSDPSEISFYSSIYKNDLLEYEKISHINSDLIIETIFTPSGEFLSYTHDGFTDTFYLNNLLSSFQNSVNLKIDNLIQNGHSNIAKLLTTITSKTWKPLILENNVVTDNTELLDEYHSSKKENSSLTQTIPYLIAKSSIQESLDVINKYIATKKLDTERLTYNIDSLNALYGLATQSLQLLQDFSTSPTSCDLRKLCDNLSKYLKNINNIIELKTETIERN